MSVVAMHLFVNVVSGYVAISGTHAINEFYRLSLYYYAGFTAISVTLYEIGREKTCATLTSL